jgi:hypothetical protein
MRASSENYKGIEYIRISSLPMIQKDYIYKSINQKLIINILKDNSLMNDCIQYQHYIIWYENIYKMMLEERKAESLSNSGALALAFK